MALSTYSELKTAIADHANSTLITSAVAADFITLVEAEMNRRIKTRRKTTRTNITIDGEFETVPADYDSVIALRITSTDPEARLTYVDAEKVVELTESTYGSSGQPIHYSIVGGEFQFIPVPDGSYTAELTYRQKIPALSDSQTSNWVLAAHPDLYLYGALRHSAAYLIDDPRLMIWDKAFEDAMLSLERDDALANYGGKLNARARCLS